MSATASPPSTDALNQPPPIPDHNAFEAHAVLREALQREGAGWAEDRLVALGALAGRQDVRELGRLANENPPVLRTFDRYGHRIDEVEFHPAWHELLDHADRPRPARAALARARAGRPHRPRRHVHDLERRGRPRVPDLDDLLRRPRPAQGPGHRRRVGAEDGGLRLRPPLRPRAGEGRGPVRHGDDREAGRLGRARQHHAAPSPSATASTSSTGHKWFCSAPMCDAFLVLAQAEGGLTCFVLPRFRPTAAATPSTCSA